ncbi:OLC1v1006131C1 [Oldenlandia corymbosa var. corymbosa]|uniref:OLC1v1006131C1 n=1 Tax=Oldenlandia corymbosa var. corymbosa TaxID=529605 RepID=A0AAV1DJN0_OLDCO|nr:OLC1v1006131C1 [Oldenlandia corymbosa var. corymbosa]
MAALNVPPADLESGENPGADVGSGSVRRHRRRRRRRRQRPSAAASSETTTDGSFKFSDTEDEERSMHSQRLGSTAGGSYEECRFSTESDGISVVSGTKRHSSRRGGSSTFSDEEEAEEEEGMVDLESGELELKVHSRGNRRECRICHLKSSAAGNGAGRGGGDQSFIELGCSCKGDLGSAHEQCAETWFKIKGNTTCEICGASAVNIAGEQTIEIHVSNGLAPAASATPFIFPENRSYCHGRRVMNFLLACMVFAFIISWLFHFKILP